MNIMNGYRLIKSPKKLKTSVVISRKFLSMKVKISLTANNIETGVFFVFRAAE